MRPPRQRSRNIAVAYAPDAAPPFGDRLDPPARSFSSTEAGRPAQSESSGVLAGQGRQPSGPLALPPRVPWPKKGILSQSKIRRISFRYMQPDSMHSNCRPRIRRADPRCDRIRVRGRTGRGMRDDHVAAASLSPRFYSRFFRLIPIERIICRQSTHSAFERANPARWRANIAWPCEIGEFIELQSNQYVARPPERSNTEAVVKLLSELESQATMAAASSTSRNLPLGMRTRI